MSCPSDERDSAVVPFVGEEEVPQHVVRDLPAQALARDEVETEVLPGVDPAEAGLVGRGRKAREDAFDSRQQFGGDSERLVVRAEEAGENVSAGSADDRVSARDMTGLAPS